MYNQSSFSSKVTGMPNEEMTISPISSANKSGYKPEEE
jgi:hypothetical protein